MKKTEIQSRIESIVTNGLGYLPRDDSNKNFVDELLREWHPQQALEIHLFNMDMLTNCAHLLLFNLRGSEINKPVDSFEKTYLNACYIHSSFNCASEGNKLNRTSSFLDFYDTCARIVREGGKLRRSAQPTLKELEDMEIKY